MDSVFVSPETSLQQLYSYILRWKRVRTNSMSDIQTGIVSWATKRGFYRKIHCNESKNVTDR